MTEKKGWIPAFAGMTETALPSSLRKQGLRGNDRGASADCLSVIPAKAGIHLSFGFLMEKEPCVYILASRPNGTLYIGVTSDLVKRTWEHKNDLVEGFTKKYGVHDLVYYEPHPDMTGAITREKQLKKWKRDWKRQLIEEANPEWRDLSVDIL